MLNNLGNTTDIRDDRRLAQGHRLDHNQGDRVEGRGVNEDVKELPDVADRSRPAANEETVG